MVRRVRERGGVGVHLVLTTTYHVPDVLLCLLLTTQSYPTADISKSNCHECLHKMS